MSDIYDCNKCNDYYHYNGIACIANTDHCKSINIYGICEACSDGYYLSVFNDI